MSEQSSLGLPLLTLNEEGARKGSLNRGCLKLPYLDCHIQWDHSTCSQNQQNNVVKSAAWNVRTLMDSLNGEYPERRTAIVATEFARYDIDIAALSVTHRVDEGQLKEGEGGYSFGFFWKEKCIHRVGFTIKNKTVSQLSELPVDINKYLMTIHLKLSNNEYTMVISVYAPTFNNKVKKKQFYCALDTVLIATAKEDKLILVGDFNARVG
ncbi:hypothetical protein Y1Q_0021602 [Alligator mississippiensis]|uniref:Endonuclease/exonuclease/phosphatase domain-containing protein n=1 Tax=Alligator mississippiensis TaxID=8496 RepID=A0A151PA97_ALLMI|nr:hypothetical protein Y1Q_0021602 [Alligator mississippiensis]